MSTRRPNFSSLLGWSVLALACPLRSGGKQETPLLLERAHRIAVFPFTSGETWAYTWVSSRGALTCRYPQDRYVRHFYSLDAATGKFTPLSDLDSSPAGEATEGPTVGDASPDGSYLLWQRYGGETHYPPISESTTGGGYYQWPQAGNYPSWLADSRHWFEVLEDGTLLMHDMQNKAFKQKMRFPAPLPVSGHFTQPGYRPFLGLCTHKII